METALFALGLRTPPDLLPIDLQSSACNTNVVSCHIFLLDILLWDSCYIKLFSAQNIFDSIWSQDLSSQYLSYVFTNMEATFFLWSGVQKNSKSTYHDFPPGSLQMLSSISLPQYCVKGELLYWTSSCSSFIYYVTLLNAENCQWDLIVWCGEWQLDFAATMSALLGVPFPFGRSVKHASKKQVLHIHVRSSAMGHPWVYMCLQCVRNSGGCSYFDLVFLFSGLVGLHITLCCPPNWKFVSKTENCQRNVT